MRALDVVRSVIQVSGKTQTEIAEEMGKSSQGTISMMLQNRNMKIENIIALLDVCGYELIARSKDGVRPEFLFGNMPEGMSNPIPSETKLKDYIRKVVVEELNRREKDEYGWKRVDLPDEDL